MSTLSTVHTRGRTHPVLSGLAGAALMIASAATPFLRRFRAMWGIPRLDALRLFPGDSLISEPRWSWTHAIDIAAPCTAVFPWLAQMGQDKAGFYSYEWLENLVGCGIHNADRIHPEWQAVQPGNALRLAPKAPPLLVREVEADSHLLFCGGQPDAPARVTWLFLLEPLSNGHCRLFSRYRVDYARNLTSWLLYGPTLLEPIGFVMDRALLRGVKRRVEAASGT